MERRTTVYSVTTIVWQSLLQRYRLSSAVACPPSAGVRATDEVAAEEAGGVRGLARPVAFRLMDAWPDGDARRMEQEQTVHTLDHSRESTVTWLDDHPAQYNITQLRTPIIID